MTETETAPAPAGDSGVKYERFLDCVHCGLCTSACPTYLETGDENDSPRGRIYLMRAVVDGRLPLSEPVQTHLDRCLDCRSCETACPSGVEYGRLIEPFRVEQQQRTGQRPPLLQRLLLHKLFPYRGRLRFGLAPARLAQFLRLDRLAEKTGLMRLLPEFVRRMQDLLPAAHRQPKLPEFLPAQGEKRASVALFLGCVADALFRDVHWATARVLQANGCDVHIPRAQGCCGAIHYHSGEGAPALKLARANVDSLLDDRFDAVIVNVAGCGSMLKDYGHLAEEQAGGDADISEQLRALAAKIRDVHEFLAELGPRAPSGTLPITVTYHDACHLAHAQQVRSQPRDLLALIPGLTVVPLPESDICCGAAGSYNLTQPEMADRLAERKRKHVVSTQAAGVVTGNAGCHLQLASTLKAAGDALFVAHPIQLLDLSYRGEPLPDAWQRAAAETEPASGS